MGKHVMGTMQHWLTTGTPFKSQKILFKARTLGSNLKYISASNIRPALPSYMIYFISLLSSHPLWASPRASRGSAIHVFLVMYIFSLVLEKHLVLIINFLFGLIQLIGSMRPKFDV